MMKKNIWGKLSSQAGESIAETLLALLISALALLMLSGAVSAGMRMVTSSSQLMQKYYDGNNSLVKREGTSVEYNITVSGLLPKDDAFEVSNTATCWQNVRFVDTPIIAYQPKH